MSGGSYQYAYHRIEELAYDIQPSSSLRKAFKAHLIKVAAACKDIEWVDSGDSGGGSEDAAILLCLGTGAPSLVLNEVLAEAEKVCAELSEAIAKAKGDNQ